MKGGVALEEEELLSTRPRPSSRAAEASRQQRRERALPLLETVQPQYSSISPSPSSHPSTFSQELAPNVLTHMSSSASFSWWQSVMRDVRAVKPSDTSYPSKRDLLTDIHFDVVIVVFVGAPPIILFEPLLRGCTRTRSDAHIWREKCYEP